MFSSRRSLLRVLERERVAFAAERARLIDVICNLAGKPWTPPPADARRDESLDRAFERELADLELVDPAQEPDY